MIHDQFILDWFRITGSLFKAEEKQLSMSLLSLEQFVKIWYKDVFILLLF